MNRWKRNLPKTEKRIFLEYLRSNNPVTKAILRERLFNFSLESRNCFHRYNSSNRYIKKNIYKNGRYVF